MADPLSLALLESTVLTEGIRFLYGQASEILERRAARIEAAKREESNLPTEPANIHLPDAFQGQLTSPQIDFNEVERQSATLLSLRDKLLNYAGGMVNVDPSDKNLIADIDDLRRVLESIYGQRITFRGEDREQSGTRVTVDANIDQVTGRFTGIKVRETEGAEYKTKLKIGSIDIDGEVIGTDLGRVKKSN